MKHIYLLLAVSLVFASCGPTTVIQSDSYEAAPAPVADVSYQSFYDGLSPYGNWINYPGYGYVWMPNAGPDFRPYATNGNWLYTNAGWTWASNYNWGWAPFHYGRWFYENGYGWMWVPGNEWAPAWVSWRGGGDYYGWAPLGPRISAEVAMSNYNPPMNYWNFMPRKYMGNPNGHNYYVNQSQNVTIINNTTIINNYSGTNRGQYAYAPGPDANEVRRYSGNNFAPVQLRQANTPGARMNGSQYVIYQPRVNASPSARGDAAGRPATPAPARYEPFSNVRPSTQYPANNQPAGNTRPAVQSPVNNQPNNRPMNNQPVNNQQPVYNPRPATQTPNNQPVNQPNNPRPATTNPGFNQPANNARPASVDPNPNNPANPNINTPSGNTNQMHSDNRMNSQVPNARPMQPAPVQRAPQQPSTPRPVSSQRVSPASPAQTTGRPSTNRNTHTNPPVQRTAAPENKPDQKPAEKPKTRQADNNG